MLERQKLLIEENEHLRSQVERLMPQPGEVRLKHHKPAATTRLPNNEESLLPLLPHPRWPSRRLAAAHSRVGRPQT